MLNYRRLIEFSSRIHTYLLALHLVLTFLFVLSLFLPLSGQFYSLVLKSDDVIGWLMVFLGCWIILASLHLSFISSVLTIFPLAITLLRLAVFYLTSFLLEFLSHLISSGMGVTFGV